jgi:hypothetical protein
MSYVFSLARTLYMCFLYVLAAVGLAVGLLLPRHRRKPLNLSKLPDDIAVLIPCPPGNVTGSSRALFELVAMFEAATRTHVIEMEKVAPAIGPIRRLIAGVASKVFPIPPLVAQACVKSKPLRDAAGKSDVVIVEFLLSAFFLVARRPLPQPTILRDHEVLVRRAWIDLKAARGLRRLEFLLQVCALWLLTLHCYRQVDRIVALTEEDAAFARKILPRYAERITAVPISFEPHDAPPADAAADVGTRNHVVMAANFWHKPNIEGLMWFLTDCAPHLKSDIVLHLVGLADALTGVRDSYDKVSVVRHGHVETWGPPLTQCHIAISPVISGTGVRVKNLFLSTLSMAVVTTSLGNEGIGLRHGVEVMIGDTPERFASGLDTLVTDQALAVRVGKAAGVRINTEFNRQRTLDRWRAAVFS